MNKTLCFAVVLLTISTAVWAQDPFKSQTEVVDSEGVQRYVSPSTLGNLDQLEIDTLRKRIVALEVRVETLERMVATMVHAAGQGN